LTTGAKAFRRWGALIVTIGAVLGTLIATSRVAALLLVGVLALAASFLAFRRPYRGIVILMIAGTLNGLVLPLNLEQVHIDIRPDQVVLVPLLVLLVPAYLTRQVTLYRTELDIPILGLVAANALSSALFSPLKSVSYQAVILMTVYALMYFVTANVLTQQPPPRLSQIVRLFGALGITHAVYGNLAMGAYILGLNVGGIQHGQTESSVSIQGTFHEANLLGIYLAIIGVFLMTYLILGRFAKRWRLRLGLAVVCYALAMTLTRSAWLVFALSVMVIFAQGLGRQKSPLRLRRPVLLTGATLLAAAIIVLFLVGPSISQRSGQENLLMSRLQRMMNLSDPTIIGRWQGYNVGFGRWQQQPLFGHGTFAGDAIGWRWFNSSIIQTMHDSGLVGLVFLLWLHVRVVVAAWRESRRAYAPFHQASLFAFALGNAIIFVTSQTSSFLWVGFPWIFMGLTIALIHASRQERTARITGAN